MTLHRAIARAGIVLTLAVACVAASVSTSEAAPLRAWLCDAPDCSGAVNIAAVDNVSNDTDITLGKIAIVPGIVLGTSYPEAGTQANPFLNLTYTISGLSPGTTRYLFATQDEFSGTDPLKFLANASVGSGTATVYGNTGIFGGPPGLAGDIICGPTAYTTATDAACSFAAPTPDYYLAIRLDVVTNGTGAASGDATIDAVPEPATMALFGLGLFGAGVAARRRRQSV